jgi:hypothetical protein
LIIFFFLSSRNKRENTKSQEGTIW